MSLLRAIPGAARVLRTVVSVGSRHVGMRRPGTGPSGEPLYRRWVVLLALICALVVCVLLALSASNSGTGVGMVVGGLVAAYAIARRRLGGW